MPITKREYDIPLDLATFWQNNYHEDLKDFLNNAQYLNLSSGAAAQIEPSEHDKNITRRIIIQPDVFKAAETLQAYDWTHNVTPQSDEQKMEAKKAFNRLVEFKERGIKHLYLDKGEPVPDWRITAIRPAQDSLFASLPVREKTLIDQAITIQLHQKYNSAELMASHVIDEDSINKKREEIAGNEPLLESFKQKQAALRDKYRGSVQTEKAPAQLVAPMQLASPSPAPSR